MKMEIWDEEFGIDGPCDGIANRQLPKASRHTPLFSRTKSAKDSSLSLPRRESWISSRFYSL